MSVWPRAGGIMLYYSLFTDLRNCLATHPKSRKLPVRLNSVLLTKLTCASEFGNRVRTKMVCET